MIGLLEPVKSIQPRPTASEGPRLMYLRSYLFMRVMAGVIGISLPIVLVLVDRVLFSGDPAPRSSLSAYYYSGVRELFVGALCAAAMFLVTYKVVELNLDNTVTVVAGVAALTIALFPTEAPNGIALTPLQDLLGETAVSAVHYVAAAAFILALAAMSYFFGLREGAREPRPGHRSPLFWRWYHWTCAGVILLAVAFMAIASLVGEPPRALLYGEAISLWAFGASWLMKGLELDMLFGTE